MLVVVKLSPPLIWTQWHLGYVIFYHEYVEHLLIRFLRQTSIYLSKFINAIYLFYIWVISNLYMFYALCFYKLGSDAPRFAKDIRIGSITLYSFFNHNRYRSVRWERLCRMLQWSVKASSAAAKHLLRWIERCMQAR